MRAVGFDYGDRVTVRLCEKQLVVTKACQVRTFYPCLVARQKLVQGTSASPMLQEAQDFRSRDYSALMKCIDHCLF